MSALEWFLTGLSTHRYSSDAELSLEPVSGKINDHEIKDPKLASPTSKGTTGHHRPGDLLLKRIGVYRL
jgi:hypothetical protein